MSNTDSYSNMLLLLHKLFADCAVDGISIGILQFLQCIYQIVELSKNIQMDSACIHSILDALYTLY